MKNSKPSRLLLLLLLYLLLATAYSIVTPIGRGADEWAHYWYAQFIAEHGRLPASPAEREAAGYKSDWPPLYHLVAAGITGWIETEGPPTFKYRADHVRRHLVPAERSEAILHTEDEFFPWQQEILVWHLGRFLSIGFSLGTLLMTYFIALEVFSTSQNAKSLSLIAVAVLAFNPRFLFTGMLFNYDSLTLLLASLFLWLSIRVVKGYDSKWVFWGLGGLAGLAVITKYLAVPLLLVIIFLVLIKDTREQESKRAGEQGSRGNTSGVSRFTLHTFRPTAVYLGQACLAFLLVTGWWFGYLLINFNEIETYGPVLGTLAPLIRGDGSDRTVEEIFAWLSGGRAPAPDYIERQSYSAWQVMAELPLTFWGNPVTEPYPLNWFILSMAVVAVVALIGLILWWRSSSLQPANQLTFQPAERLLFFLLLLYCLLPLPFMIVRLFGARDALEAVQGRHLLFLSGPALAILLVWGLSFLGQVSGIKYQVSSVKYDVSRFTFHVSEPKAPYGRFTFHLLLGLLMLGAVGQLIYMGQVYARPLPVRTTPYQSQPAHALPPITLPGGAQLIDYTVTVMSDQAGWRSFLLGLAPRHPALQVSLIWQGGEEPAPEDYQVELALIDVQGQIQAGWLAYQTQAYYPTRAWEAGDIIRDEGWLPLTGLLPGDYELRLRLLDQTGPVMEWQTLTSYKLSENNQRDAAAADQVGWKLWRQGEILTDPLTLRERETVQFILNESQGQSINESMKHTPQTVAALPPQVSFEIEPDRLTTALLQLIGPDGGTYSPVAGGPTWANFIIGPEWPAGDYRAQLEGEVLFRVAKNGRTFQPPVITSPLEVNFENQLKLLGYELPTRRVQPGEGLPLTLYWQGLRWMGEDFVIFNHLLDNQQVAWGGYDRRPQENYSVLLWAPGEIVTDGFAVPVAPMAPAGVYRLNLGWYRQIDGVAKSLLILNPETGQPTESSSVTIGPIKVGGPPPGVTLTEVAPQTEVNLILGEQIKLLGFDLASQQVGEPAISESVDEEAASTPRPLDVSSSSSLQLTFYWQALTMPQTDYTVFVHVRNAAGDTVTQQDGPPVAGAYPTSLWDAGEIIEDKVSLSLNQLKPGRYEVVAGMYDLTTGIRLIVPDSPDGAIRLQSFEVTE